MLSGTVPKQHQTPGDSVITSTREAPGPIDPALQTATIAPQATLQTETADNAIIDAALTLPAGRLQEAINEVRARVEVERALAGMQNYYSDVPDTRPRDIAARTDRATPVGSLQMSDCAHGNPFPVRKNGAHPEPMLRRASRMLLDLELGPASADPLRVS